MNIYYAKTILYAYGGIEDIANQIDELIEKKAYSSMTDISPAQVQCESIIDYTEQKIKLINLKVLTEKVINKFSSEWLDCLDYKYFRKKSKKYFEEKNFDFSSRKYFRLQVKIAETFSEKIEKVGLTDKKFEEDYLVNDFFKKLLKCVIEKEESSYKNKPKGKKENVKRKVTLKKSA